MASSPSKALLPMHPAWKPDTLPPFPAVALKALNLMAGTETSLLELCNLIRTDAAFSTAILQIANSPLVAFSKNITSVLQASMLLGFQRLRSVVITVGLKSYLRQSFSPLLQACWRHSVATAIIAERAASRSGFDRDFAYTAGIMHDIGRVAMATALPEAYARVLEKGADQPRDLLHSEWEFCGIDHCQAGRALVVAWNIPEAFLDVTLSHHDQPAAGRSIASILPQSCLLADSIGFGVTQYRAPQSYKDTTAQFPEAARSSFPEEPNELVSEIGDEITVIETA
ncbi:MAG: HDOD domain-containing protein [Terriglobales bacterium]|jgi:putative nucleotidyltransferase with HDIG domain